MGELHRYRPRLTEEHFHPFNKITGAKQVAQEFWQPLKNSLTSLRNRMDILFAGENSLSEEVKMVKKEWLLILDLWSLQPRRSSEARHYP